MTNGRSEMDDLTQAYVNLSNRLASEIANHELTKARLAQLQQQPQPQPQGVSVAGPTGDLTRRSSLGRLWFLVTGR